MKMTSKALTGLLETLSPIKRGCVFGILPHDNPDSDSIASSKAIYEILCSQGFTNTEIIYSGLLLSKQNKQLVVDLGMQMHKANWIYRPSKYDYFVLIDTPGTNASWIQKNLIDPDKLLLHFDHHQKLKGPHATFSDIREVGSTSSILGEYVKSLKRKDDQAFTPKKLEEICTGLYLGIAIDTNYLRTGATYLDSLIALYCLTYANKDIIKRFDKNEMDFKEKQYFGSLLMDSIKQGKTVLINGGVLDFPSNAYILAKAADEMLYCEEVNTVIATGIIDDTLQLIIRTEQNDLNYVTLAQRIHETFGEDHDRIVVNGGGRNGKGRISVKLSESYPDVQDQFKVIKDVLLGFNTEGEFRIPYHR